MEGKRGRPRHPDPVTPAEAKVLALIRDGHPNAEIAVRLGISVNTVRYHVSNLLAKANATDRAALKDWRPKSGSPRSRRLGWLGPLIAPKIAAAGTVAVGVVAAVAIAASLASHEPRELAAENAEPAAPFQGAVVGELIRQGPSLAIVESGTGQAFVLTRSLNFDRYVGEDVFILGEIHGRHITPAAGTVVGPRSRCAGVLSESNGTVSIKGGCAGMELDGIPLDTLVAMRSERVMVSVLECTMSTNGRLSNPHLKLYDSPLEPAC